MPWLRDCLATCAAYDAGMIRFAPPTVTRRSLLLSALSGTVALALPADLMAAPDAAFTRWVANFRSQAIAR